MYIQGLIDFFFEMVVIYKNTQPYIFVQISYFLPPDGSR